MKIKLLLFFFSILVVLSGCGKSDGEESGPIPDEPAAKHVITISPTVESLHTDGSGFEQGDCVGLYVSSGDGGEAATLLSCGNHIDNMRFRLSGGWIPDLPVYWPEDGKHADFLLYYPYRPISDAHSVEIETDIRQDEETNYRNSDFMIGRVSDVAPVENPIGITTRHVLSRLHITITPGAGYTQESLNAFNADVCINGVRTRATVNLATSAIVPAGERNSIIPLRCGDGFRAIVVPQTVANEDLITVTVDGRMHAFSGEFIFESDKEYGINIKPDKLSDGMNVEINPWNSDENDYGGTAE